MATQEPTRGEPTTPTDTEKTTKRARTTEGKRAAHTEQEPTREHTSALVEDDSVMNPRDIRALPKRPPPAIPKEDYPWPDPLLPLAQDERNPELKDLQVIMPVTTSATTNLKDKFGLPWAMWLAGCPLWLRRFLLYQGTFSVGKDLTFSVTDLNPNIYSWVLGNYKGDAVKRTNADVILTVIKRALWLNDMFRAHVNRVFTRHGTRGDINEHAVLATNSLTLTFFDNSDSLGQPATVVQLRGRPVGDTTTERRVYATIVRSVQFWVGLVPLTLAGAISCQLCKAETHPSYGCPFPKTEGWFGPANEGAERHAERVKRFLAREVRPDDKRGKGPQRKGGPSQKKGRK